MKQRTLRFGFALLTVVGLAAPAFADVADDAPRFDALGVSPTSRRLDLKAGETRAQTITILNDGETTIKYHFKATDYQVRDGDYSPSFNTLTDTSRASASWFSFPTGDKTLLPHDQVTVDFTVQVPQNAASGGHYGVLFAETVPPPPAAGGSNIARVKRVGSVFYLTVAGSLVRSGQFQPQTPPFWFHQPPVVQKFAVKNTGNVHFDVTGRLELNPLWGKAPPAVDVKGIVLPGTTRNFSIGLQTGQAIGIYKMSGSVEFLGSSHDLDPKWVLVAPVITVVIVLSTIFILIVLAAAPVVRRRRK